MKQFRILQFITPVGFYGAEHWVLAFANNLKAGHVTCDLALTEEGGGQDLRVAEYYPTSIGKVHLIPQRHRLDYRVVYKLCQTIRQRRIDIIHTHGYKSNILGLIAAKRCGIKSVTTLHGSEGRVNFKRALLTRADTLSYRLFDRVVPLSRQLVNDLARLRLPEGKVAYIENGVDLTELDRYQDTPPSKGHSAHLGYVGQLIPRKGVKDLIRLFDRVWRTYPYAKLSLVGDGPQRSDLEAFARSLASGENIRFLGFRTERLDIMRQFDCLLMTSSLEGIPRCIMEAMVLGVPVAAYRIPGVDQLITRGVTGITAPHGDWQQLADECLKVLDDRDYARTLRENARALVIGRFSAARMAEEYLSLFAELMI